MRLKTFLVAQFFVGLLLFVLAAIIVQPILVNIGAVNVLAAFVTLWMIKAAEERRAEALALEARRIALEQQRTANLIAWQALTGESSRVEIRKDLFG